MPAEAIRRRIKPAEERRREILDAAVRLFGERGFDETTVQDIAEASGVATGTVYLYFPSKERLLHAIHEQFHEGLEGRFAEAGLALVARKDRGETIDHRTAVDEIFDALVGYSRERSDLWEVMWRYIPRLESTEEVTELEHGHIRFLAEAFRLGQEHGFIRTSDPEMAAYLFSAVNLAIGRAIGLGDPPDLDRFLAQARELYYRALGPGTEG
jgi:AcrR family transcriptional regulator